MRLIATLSTLFIALLIAREASAAVKITAVANASRFTENNGTSYTIYGGMAGVSPPVETGGTVDNCPNTVADFGGCNKARIYPNLILAITFTADKDGQPLLIRDATSGSSSNTPIPSEPGTPTNVVTKGTSITAYYRWQNLCGNMTDATNGITQNCTFTGLSGGTAKIDMKVGVSGPTTAGGTPDLTLSGAEDESTTVTFIVSDATGGDGRTNSLTGDCTDDTVFGLCGFRLVAGDEKVVLKDPKGATGFPQVSGTALSFVKLRLFYEAVGRSCKTYSECPDAFAKITSRSPQTSVDIKADSSTSAVNLEPSRVEGFSNDQTYAFKVAVEDSAGNIGFFTPPGGDDYCNYDGKDSSGGCHIATPGEVVGVLSKDVNCFIATAAYGSQLAPQVETFRRFRDAYLKTTSPGRKFVDFYYEHSPRYARMIAENQVLRAISRGFLWPLLAYAQLSLKIGALPAFAAIIVALALALTGLRAVRRHRAS